MQPRVVQVGPLAASSATKVALSQTAAAAGALALNGATGTATANNICLSQNGTAATSLLLNGALSQTRFASPTIGVVGANIAMLPSVQPIFLTSAGNDSGITFAVVGMDANNGTLTETLQGTNTSVVASLNSYKAILSIVPSGNTAAAVIVGTMGFATLDTARRVIFTSGGNDSGITITISGTNWAGNPISEIVTGANVGAATTVLDYLTVTQVKISGATATTIEVGTNGVAGSQWVNFDPWAQAPVSGQCVVSGTANYTVQTSNDDPNSYANSVAPSAVTWDSNFVGISSATASTQFGLAQAPLWMRVLLNSETGSGFVRMSVAQSSAVPY